MKRTTEKELTLNREQDSLKVSRDARRMTKKRRREKALSGMRSRTIMTRVFSTSASLLLLLSRTTVAFQSPASLYPKRFASVRRQVVTDPDSILIETLSASRRREIERLYQMSASNEGTFLMEDGEIPYSELQLHQLQERIHMNKVKQSSTETNNSIPQKQQHVQSKGQKQHAMQPDITTTTATHTIEDASTIPSSLPAPAESTRAAGTTSKRRSRSSTMPGFHAKSDQQLANERGMRFMERSSGRKKVDTPEAKRQRGAVAGHAMYQASASVPDSMIQFAKEIHREDRISRKEEIELGTKTQEAVRLQNLYDVLKVKLQREPTDEEWCAAAGKINMEAIKHAIEEGLDAKNKLVTANLRMVQSVVNTYIRNGLSSKYNAGDLMQEGIMALIRAAEKFEPDRGWKFSTYAMYWVRASVKRSQIYQSRTVTVPQRLQENHKRLLKLQHEWVLTHGRKPTQSELGGLIGLSQVQVERCFTAMKQQCYSLDQELTNTRHPNKDGNRDTLLELIDATTMSGDDDRLERMLLKEDLIETLHRHLSPQEVELLLLRYGLKEIPTNQLSSNKQLTIAELSRIFGLKPDKVRRMIQQSLNRLQNVGPEEWIEFQRVLS